MQRAFMSVMNMEHSTAAAVNPIFSEKRLTDECNAFPINKQLIIHYLNTITFNSKL